MGLSSIIPHLESGLKTAFNPQHIGGTLGTLGSMGSTIGNAASGVIPQTQPSQNPTTALSTARTGDPSLVAHAINDANATPMSVEAMASSGLIPGITPPNASAVPIINDVPVGQIKGEDFNSVYGVDTGTALTNLFNSESATSANGLAQSIIKANIPNVAQGQANIDTGLAASGISPSSSVAAIENANYQGTVASNDLKTLADVNLQEQGMQQDLLTQLLSTQQKRQTDSSGWSIFGDVMSGIGDIASIAML